MPQIYRILCAAALALLLASVSAHAADPPDSRTVRFSYSATITGLSPSQPVRIWVPIAHTTIEQQVTLLNQQFPAQPQQQRDSRYGNQIAYCAATAKSDGTLSLTLQYQITRHAAAPEPSGASNDPLPPAAYLQPNALVPAGGPTTKLLAGKTLPQDHTQLAHALFDLVDDTLTYRKDQPGWGRGDAVWACNSRFGNCTDFTSLFLSLARGQHIPAKYEMGFPLPPTHGHGTIDGYHCWAWFLDSQNCWTPVDPSHAKQDPAMRQYLFGHLDPDRIAFTIGRDITLAPPQAGPPLNYFIYPYVETAGQPYPSDRIHCNFTYEDD